MKHKDIIKYQSQSIAELQAEVKKLETQLIEVSMKRELGQQKNVRQGKTIRQDIARLKTIIRINELRVQPEAAVESK